MYDPLVKKLGPAFTGGRVGIVGLGGLGLLGIKIARALGAQVTAISRSPAKEKLARDAGADTYIVTSSPEQLLEARGSMDLILNTIPTFHNYDIYTKLLASRGQQVILGLHKGIVAGYILKQITGGCSQLTMSGIGGIRNTQAVIDLCARHNIVPDHTVMPCEKLNWIYEQLESGNDAGMRYVLDIAGSLNAGTAAKCTAPPPTLAPAASGGQSVLGGLGEALRSIFCCKSRLVA